MSTKAEKSPSGFTLIELLVVIAIIAILAAMSVPVLTRGNVGQRTATCSGNLRQLQLGWQMYGLDNSDTLMPNTSVLRDRREECTATNGWVNDNPYVNQDTQALTGGLAGEYVRQPQYYHCPADDSTVRDDGVHKRLRSYTMNISMNCCPTPGGPVPYVGSYDISWHKIAQIGNPNPERALVFIEEHESTISTGLFVINNRWFRAPNTLPTDWVNFPAIRHGSSTSVSFADCHAENWKIREPNTLRAARRVRWGRAEHSAGAKDADWSRFSGGTPRNNPPD